ncbi:MAG: YgfZ/GcvT domain-containing protein [Acidimicrobiales bacterium]
MTGGEMDRTPVPVGAERAAVEADYEALRRGGGAHRLERDVLVVAGPEAEGYLQGQLSQDVAGMAPGDARDALLLEPDGKLCALLRVTALGERGYALDVDAGHGEAVAARLRRFRLRTKVEIEPVPWPCVALRGPGAAAAVTAGEPGAHGPWVLAVAWHGVAGVDVLGPGAEAAVGPAARWCGPAAWEALRIEAGIPAMGRELDAKTIAAEAGLVERAVSLTKGCFTGQELVARLDARGNRVARHLRGLVVAEDGGGDAGPATLASGTELVGPGGDKVVGRCTSAVWCPGLGRVAGLGYVHRSVDVPGAVALGAPGGPRVEVRALPLVG